jgi:D-tyrosyl-tRNA(Tyr) deacylase
MRIVVQRSGKSKVIVDKQIVGQIEKGLVLLVSFTHNDTEKQIDELIHKLLHLRIFDDDNGIMNLSVLDIKGEILSISQFTLYADTKKGNRPSYINAMKNEDAKKMYDLFNKKLSQYIKVETGVFGADMNCQINNDGPITIMLESRNENDKK